MEITHRGKIPKGEAGLPLCDDERDLNLPHVNHRMMGMSKRAGWLGSSGPHLLVQPHGEVQGVEGPLETGEDWRYVDRRE